MSDMQIKHKKIMAAAGILLTTMIWGGSFVVMKNSVDVMPPAYLLAVRFTAAAVALLVFSFRRILKLGRETLACGAVMGLFLELSYLLQTYGLKYTTASKNAFITTLYVIIVPFLHWFLSKKRPGVHHMLAAFLAVIGLALLSLQGSLGLQFGDFLTLLCGISFAFHVVFTDRFTEQHDPVGLTAVQITVAAVLSWCLAPFLDGGFEPAVLAEPGFIGGILYLAILSTMVGFLLQSVGQKYLSANTSAILLSLESVFGALFSVIFLGERLTGRMFVGCGFMLGAVLLAEVRPGKQKPAADSLPGHDAA